MPKSIEERLGDIEAELWAQDIVMSHLIMATWRDPELRAAQRDAICKLVEPVTSAAPSDHGRLLAERVLQHIVVLFHDPESGPRADL